MQDKFSLDNITTYQSGVVQSNVHRTLKKFTDKCLSEHGLTAMQWFIIGTLLDAGPQGMRLSDLAKQITTTLGYLTNAINLLEARGIIIRREHETDSRTKLLSVSENYKPQCKKIEESLRRKMREAFYVKISPEELRIYIKVLYKFSQLETIK